MADLRVKPIRRDVILCSTVPKFKHYSFCVTCVRDFIENTQQILVCTYILNKLYISSTTQLTVLKCDAMNFILQDLARGLNFRNLNLQMTSLCESIQLGRADVASSSILLIEYWKFLELSNFKYFFRVTQAWYWFLRMYVNTCKIHC